MVILLSGCAADKTTVALTPATFEALPAFAQDNHSEALAALLNACGAGLKGNLAQYAGAPDVTSAAWLSACARARNVPAHDSHAAQQFFRRHFQPYRVDGAQGHFTGYYVPLLHASRQRIGAFQHPAYALPPELKNGTANTPYFDRAAIESGALAGRGLELLWFNDPVMLFFAHVQGSATVQLTDGRTVRLVFAGKNGLPYHAIGKTLVQHGALAQDAVSMQSIRDWLYAHPTEAAAVMQSNPSFIFFALDEKAADVRGSHGTPLMAGRSLAVDHHFIPLGIPLYVATRSAQGTPLNRLMMAQDTGSAIKGAARGDIFFGYGEEAEHLAGAMNAQGELFVLLPKDGADEQ